MFENLTKQQKKILIIISVIVSVGVIYFIYNKTTPNTNNLDENILITNELIKENTSIQEESEEDNLVIIHITGAVKTPGIVKLKEGSRIEDAIEAAGGLTEEADISKVNLAYILEDGIKIRIPSLYDEDTDNQNIFIEGSGENIIEENDESYSSNSNKNININKATETELQNLPGIGASLAARIVEYREQNGKFSQIEDIKNVSGIGESKYNNIKDLICVK